MQSPTSKQIQNFSETSNKSIIPIKETRGPVLHKSRSWLKSALRVALAMVLAFGFLFGSFNVREATAVEGKIGFLDLQKSIAGTKEWKKSFITFKTKFKKEQKKIKVREDRMKKMLEDLNKQSFVLDPALKKQKEDKFRKAKVDFERYVQDKNAEFSVTEKEMTEKMLKRMIAVIKDLGKKKKYSMVIEQKALLYHDSAEELTGLAIKAYDKKYK